LKLSEDLSLLGSRRCVVLKMINQKFIRRVNNLTASRKSKLRKCIISEQTVQKFEIARVQRDVRRIAVLKMNT
jgi:hypothetical protein